MLYCPVFHCITLYCLPSPWLHTSPEDASKFFNEIHKGVKIDAYLRPEAPLGERPHC